MEQNSNAVPDIAYALSDERVIEIANAYAHFVTVGIYDVTRYDSAEDFINCVRECVRQSATATIPAKEHWEQMTGRDVRDAAMAAARQAELTDAIAPLFADTSPLYAWIGENGIALAQPASATVSVDVANRAINDALSAMPAQSTPLVANIWSGMNSAPLDGTEILIRYPLQGNVKRLAYFNTVHRHWESKGLAVFLSEQKCEWTHLPGDTALAQPAAQDKQMKSLSASVADALRPFCGRGQKVIWREPFRWHDDNGVLSNHYDGMSLNGLSDEFGYEIIADMNGAGIISTKEQL